MAKDVIGLVGIDMEDDGESLEMDVDKMIAFFDGYLEAYDNCFRGNSDIIGVAYTWVEWLEYNIKRVLGKYDG